MTMEESRPKRQKIEEEKSSEKFSFNWLLEGVQSSVEFESELFTPLSTIPVKFRLKAHRGLAVEYDEGEEFPYEFYLLKCSDELIPKDLKVQCEVELRFGYGYSYFIRSKTCDVNSRMSLFTGYYKPKSYGEVAWFRVGAQGQGVENFIDLLFNFEFFNTYLPTRELVKDPNTCLTDFKSLYESKFLADVNIQAGDGILEAHKAMLVARSPVFKAMFDNKFVEGKTNCIKMEASIDSCSVDYFLRYLYSGDMGNVNFDTLCNVYSLANKYLVADLSRHCSTLMSVELSSDNVLQIVVLANDNSDALLKEKALNHCHQHLQEIIHQKAWKDFVKNHPVLFKEILKLDG